MAIAPVTGQKVNNATAGTSLAFPAQTITAGEDIVVVVAILTTTVSVSSITDTKGNTYTQKAAVNNGSAIRIEIWASHGVAAQSNNVVTVNLSGSSLASAAYQIYSGVAGLGNTNTNTGSSVFPESDLSTQDANNFLVLGYAIGSSSSDTATAKDNVTIRQTEIPALTTAGAVLADNTSAPGPVELISRILLSTSRSWAAAGVELRSGGGTTPIKAHRFTTPLPTVVVTKSQFGETYPVVPPPFLQSVAVSGVPFWPSFTFGEGVVGVSYSQQFDLYPALSPTTFTLVSGSLPPGLSLSSVSADIGRLSGTPTAPGSFSFTLRATNPLGTANKSFTLLVVLPGGGGAFTFWG